MRWLTDIGFCASKHIHDQVDSRYPSHSLSKQTASNGSYSVCESASQIFSSSCPPSHRDSYVFAPTAVQKSQPFPIKYLDMRNTHKEVPGASGMNIELLK